MISNIYIYAITKNSIGCLTSTFKARRRSGLAMALLLHSLCVMLFYSPCALKSLSGAFGNKTEQISMSNIL